MKGNAQVLTALADALTVELTAINEFYLHYRMQEHWGYPKLAHHSRDASMKAMKHVDKVLERMLFLEASPNLARYEEIQVGDTCEAQLRHQHQRQVAYVGLLRKHIQMCLEQQDFVTKELLDGLLEKAEHRVNWLETQFHRIQKLGMERYLTEHMS